METLNTNIVGRFTDEQKAIIKNLPADAQLVLEREPSNPYDKNAIKIMAPSLDATLEEPAHVFVGYVPRGHAEMLKERTLVSCAKVRGGEGMDIKIDFA